MTTLPPTPSPKHCAPVCLQLPTPALPRSYFTPEDIYLIEPQGATNDIYSSSLCAKENADKVYWPAPVWKEPIHVGDVVRHLRRAKETFISLFSTVHMRNPVAWEQLVPSLMLLASLVLLLVRCELTLALQISHIPNTKGCKDQICVLRGWLWLQENRQGSADTAITSLKWEAWARAEVEVGCEVHASRCWSFSVCSDLVAFLSPGSSILPSFSFCSWLFYVFVLNFVKYFVLSLLERTNGTLIKTVLSCFQPYQKQ